MNTRQMKMETKQGCQFNQKHTDKKYELASRHTINHVECDLFPLVEQKISIPFAHILSEMSLDIKCIV